jgi:hypothetical protein
VIPQALGSFDQVVAEIGDYGLSEEGLRELGRRSGMLLIQERWRSHSSFNDGRWTFHMGRAIRKYAVVRNLENPTAAPDRRGKRQQGIYGGWGGERARMGDDSRRPSVGCG